jgi:hypothetical protein
MSLSPIVDRIRIIPRPNDFLDRNVGASGEIFFNAATNSLRVYTGKNQGGFEIARSDLSNIPNSNLLAKSTAAGLASETFVDTAISNIPAVDLSSYAPLSNPTFTGTVSGVTATHVGLGNVTNESKATMFNNPTFTGTVSGAGISTGIVMLYKATSNPPPGWLIADGSIISQENYPALTPFLAAIDAISGGTMVSNDVISSSASSFIDTRNSTRAHDGNTAETAGGWHSDIENQPWLQFYFTDGPRTINAYRIYGRTDGFNFGESGFNLFGSNDGSDFTTIDTRPVGSDPISNGFKDFAVTSPGSYQYYRLQSLSSYYQVVGEWQLFTDASITTQYKLPGNGFGAGDLSWPSGYSYIIKT